MWWCDMVRLYNMDCMKAMRSMPDKTYDLAIVDPPYGIKDCVCSNSTLHKRGSMKWNNQIPSKKYFQELERVSKHQIIWGANYYVGIHLPVGRIVHDKIAQKDVQFPNYSDADIASQSFNRLIKIFRYGWKGNCQGEKVNWKNEGIDRRIHPTQKPVALYKWCLRNYAKPGHKILDTHVGSGSSAIACQDLGFDFDGYELDKNYFDLALNRLINHQRQMIFNGMEVI